ncbi:hypothetical protein FoTM2_017017 [Fusarium oxysporum f. sp. vasinfectum]|nr:hypothetical protein FoTM2_017017 [Fusarium oxysporum f. sp. vasinfectum]
MPQREKLTALIPVGYQNAGRRRHRRTVQAGLLCGPHRPPRHRQPKKPSHRPK